MRSVYLLINLGTPSFRSPASTKVYLKEFLMDGRVISINSWLRYLLVNFLIVPFRYKKSAKAYAKIWTEDGSPLRTLMERLTSDIKKQLSPETESIYYAMR